MPGSNVTTSGSRKRHVRPRLRTTTAAPAATGGRASAPPTVPLFDTITPPAHTSHRRTGVQSVAMSGGLSGASFRRVNHSFIGSTFSPARSHPTSPSTSGGAPLDRRPPAGGRRHQPAARPNSVSTHLAERWSPPSPSWASGPGRLRRRHRVREGPTAAQSLRRAALILRTARSHAAEPTGRPQRRGHRPATATISPAVVPMSTCSGCPHPEHMVLPLWTGTGAWPTVTDRGRRPRGRPPDAWSLHDEAPPR